MKAVIKIFLGIVVFCSTLGWWSISQAEEVSYYALVVGNNAAPTQAEFQSIAPLHYADDDAIRFHQFFLMFAKEVKLLTVLDPESQKRYPNLAQKTNLPTIINLQASIKQMTEHMKADQEQGHQVVFYLTFSGHGDITEQGQPFLAFLDQGLSRHMLWQDVLADIPADYVHLVIDACHAGAVVGIRGLFDKQEETQATPLTATESARFVGFSPPSNFPSVGALVSATADQEAHEWSRIQSGIFTHEVLSGLLGPADVNADGKIEYSEIHSFVTSANRDIKDTRAIPRVVAKPPQRNQNVALISFDHFQNTANLSGNPSSLGHFFIELENGQRYLDANLEGLLATSVVLPIESNAFLRTKSKEALIKAGNQDRLDINQLDFQKKPISNRGSIDAAFRKALFASPYNETYYKGFVDRIGTVGVSFDSLEMSKALAPDAGYSSRRTWALTCLITAGASSLAFLVTGGLTIKAKQDYDGVQYQRETHEAVSRYNKLGAAALGTGVVAVALGVTGLFLLQEKPVTSYNSQIPSPFVWGNGSVSFDGKTVTFGFSW